MVTFAFLFVFILLVGLVVMIDIILYHYLIIDAIGNLFYTQIVTDRLILYLTFAIGFISAAIIDIRIMKKKGKKQTK